MRSSYSDRHILALAARYVRRLWEVERTHFLHLGGDYSDELAILLGELDPVDIRNVVEALDEMRLREVGTESREGTDGKAFANAPLSDCSVLRSSVPPSFFPESRRV